MARQRQLVPAPQIRDLPQRRPPKDRALSSPHPTRTHHPLGDEPKLVWQSFGFWIRTVRPGLAPSEQVAAIALGNTFPEVLVTTAKTVILVKFLRDRVDLSKVERTSLAGTKGRTSQFGTLKRI